MKVQVQNYGRMMKMSQGGGWGWGGVGWGGVGWGQKKGSREEVDGWGGEGAESKQRGGGNNLPDQKGICTGLPL
jgi:hypothetical protein